MAMTMAQPKWAGLASLGAVHAIVDGSCAAMAFSLIGRRGGLDASVWHWIVAYNMIAFGSQSLLGLATDRWRAPRLVAALGCGVTAAGVMAFGFSPIPALCVAGVGNALFHAGGGCISLHYAPGKAAAPGLFVAPGAVGLALGTIAGTSGYFTDWIFALLLGASCLAIGLMGMPRIDYRRPPVETPRGHLLLVLTLLLICIGIRSLVGLTNVFPWKTDTLPLLALVLATAGGKAVGGLLADRFGWTRVAVGALLVSGPLVSLGANWPTLAIPGVFLFQMTMPVTLAAVGLLFPGRASFAFGLASLALVVGALPVFAGLAPILGNQWFLLVLVVLSAASVYAGLRELAVLSRKTELGDGTGAVPDQCVRECSDCGHNVHERRSYVG